jgi:hypothetical protein
MSCVYCGNLHGECLMWEEGSSLNPEGADDHGNCMADEDEDPTWCQSYESAEDEDVCDYCGEPLGFCASDCETLDEDFEE